MDFKEKIFEVVKRIPKGKVLTYKEVARLAGRPRAWRTVGNILGKNRDSRVPCHRVIRSDGKVGGYRGGPPHQTRTGRRRRQRNQSLLRCGGGQKRKIELLKREGAL